MISLRFRLFIAYSALITAGLLVNVGLTIANAGKRIMPEVSNATMLAGNIIRGTTENIGESARLEAAIEHLTQNLDRMRHVRVWFQRDMAALRPPPEQEPRPLPPEWFVALVHPGKSLEFIPIDTEGRRLGFFVVAADPEDEIAELWESLRAIALDSLMMMLAGFFLTALVVRIGLHPLKTLNLGLKTLMEGDNKFRLSPRVAAEFTGLVARFNALGESLHHAEQENSALRARLVSLQEEERKVLSQELHDEIGPHLFAIRAHAKTLANTLAKAPEAGSSASRQGERALQAVVASADELQSINRRILNRLRPIALNELGLTEALDALVRFWQATQGAVIFSADVPADLPPLPAALATALYRIAQEALTNAVRHAEASAISLALTPGEDKSITLSIRDNGKGLKDRPNFEGLGLVGIQERTRAFGGEVSLKPGPKGGLEVLARFPAAALAPPSSESM